METTKTSNWKVGKRILRYIVGTINFGIMYSTTNYGSQVGYTDIDFAGSIDDRKSTNIVCFPKLFRTILKVIIFRILLLLSLPR